MPITFDDLDEMAHIVRTQGMDPSGPWKKYHGQVMALPDWFDNSLDPFSDAYRQQQFRLWQAACGTDGGYDPGRDELAPEIGEFDAIRFPAFFSRRDPAAVDSAGDHIIAMGHMLKRSGLVAGDWALEYGAGFGQTALTLARLGVNVDTVDINPLFNAAVAAQGQHFGVPLRAFQGAFGDNPRGDGRYKLVLFYEAFHHCADFTGLIRRLHDLVQADGQVLMAGEPISRDNPTVPYPWGIRLDAETLAVIRVRHWLELGYQEDFLARAFIAGGFTWQKHPCHLTHYGEAHSFRPRPQRISMESYSLPAPEAESWHAPEADGRWTRGRAVLPIDSRGHHDQVALCITNHFPFNVMLQIGTPDGRTASHGLAGHSMTTVRVPTPAGTSVLVLDSAPFSPAAFGAADTRALGVFVHWFEYQ